jgi:hypothetical protein
MSPGELREAMRFGSKISKAKTRLGMFGLGLKLASIAQASTLLVISRKAGLLAGRAWTDEGLRKGFYCEILEDDEVKDVCALSQLPFQSKAGTWVYWDTLFRYSNRFRDPHRLCEELTESIRDYLALHLHRFLGKLNISIDIFDEETGETGVPRTVGMLDPFAYSESGLKGFPLRLVAPGPYGKQLTIRAHIWPARSNAPEYKLPGGANKRQGLYFYRNDRLLSGGTWHGIREEDPHASLARVEIDLAIDVEREASVDVRKARVKLTPELSQAIEQAKAKNGTTFSEYLSAANTVYRKAESHDPRSIPLIPAGGYPRELTQKLKKLLDRGFSGRYRELEFVWTGFDPDSDAFFRIDRGTHQIFLNEQYRELFRQGTRSSPVDAALVKTLLFVLLNRSLELERTSSKQEKWLTELNSMLATACNYELVRTS